MAGEFTRISQSNSQSVSHRVNCPGVYTIYVRSDLLYLVSTLKVIEAISVNLFTYSVILLPSSQKIRGIAFVIVIFCKF